MKPLRLQWLREILPELDELRPVLDLAVRRSEADPRRAWSAAGEVETLEDRLLSPDLLSRSAAALAQGEARHLEAVYRAVGDAVARLSEGDGAAACGHFLEAARREEERDRPERAEAYARSAWKAARDERDQRPAALALRRWARAARAQGALEEALRRYGESHAMARAIGDLRGAAEAGIGAGNVLEQEGRWEEAEGWYRRALEALDELGTEGEHAPERWHALLNLHIALRFRGELAASLSYLERAEAVARAAGDTGARPFLENARGQLHAARDEREAAVRCFRDALEAAAGTHASVTVRLNLAEALLSAGRALEAGEEARRAEREALAGAAVGKLPEVYRILGRVADHQGHSEAFVLFEEALGIIRDRGLPALEEALTFQAYAECEARHGDPEAARKLHDQARERYEKLGIRGYRHPWADYFDPEHEPEPLAGSDQEGPHDDA